jgi:hypothetical protein
MSIKHTSNKVIAKTNHKVTCGCPGSEPGKINTDPSTHSNPKCWIRRMLLSKRLTINTSAVPRECEDGYGLGVAPN